MYLAYGDDSGNWKLDVIETDRFVGWNAALAISANDDLHLAYRASDRGLHYVHAVVPEPSTLVLAVSGLLIFGYPLVKRTRARRRAYTAK